MMTPIKTQQLVRFNYCMKRRWIPSFIIISGLFTLIHIIFIIFYLVDSSSPSLVSISNQVWSTRIRFIQCSPKPSRKLTGNLLSLLLQSLHHCHYIFIIRTIDYTTCTINNTNIYVTIIKSNHISIFNITSIISTVILRLIPSHEVFIIPIFESTLPSFEHTILLILLVNHPP